MPAIHRLIWSRVSGSRLGPVGVLQAVGGPRGLFFLELRRGGEACVRVEKSSHAHLTLPARGQRMPFQVYAKPCKPHDCRLLAPFATPKCLYKLGPTRADLELKACVHRPDAAAAPDQLPVRFGHPGHQGQRAGGAGDWLLC